MNSDKKLDRCVLCGKYTALTFEHIPPRKALNNTPIRSYNVFDVMVDGEKMPWDFNGRKYKIMQKGMGLSTLCEKCNNNTGSWYAKDYGDFSNKMYLTVNNATVPNDKTVYAICTGIYPLRIFKQIICMFLSVNNLFELNELQNFVKDRYTNVFFKNKYRVYMYINNGEYLKMIPISTIGKLGEGSNVFKDMQSITISELTTIPLGFVLCLNNDDKSMCFGVDITGFCDYSYDDKVDLEIPLLFKEVNTSIPIDFRTKEEVEETVLNNKNISEVINNEQ